MKQALSCTVLGVAPVAFAQAGPTRAVQKVSSSLRIVIPANVNGGWDQTGRALGAALKACGATDEVVYENIGGKGGTIGLARYVEQYDNEPNTILIGGFVMVGAIEHQKAAINLNKIEPLARVASDYVVVAVSPQSKVRSPKDFVHAMHQSRGDFIVAGGSAGGVDHMFAGMLARVAKLSPDKLQYVPFSGGSDAMDYALAGKSQAVISGYSELSAAIRSGKLRVVGVSARQSIYGIPSFREQGVDADIANWRAVFTGNKLRTERYLQLRIALQNATDNEVWRQTLVANGWGNAWQTGEELDSFLNRETMTAQVMNFLLQPRG